MATRRASCRCGQLAASCRGEPASVSVCHCLDCLRRSGSAFAAQARWADADVTVTGRSRTWTHREGDSVKATFRFCPECGGTIAYALAAMPGITAIPLGAFADPLFPSPDYSVFEERRHGWVTITGEGIAHHD